MHLLTCFLHWQVLGAPLAAALLSLNGKLGLRGWQWLFLIEGLPTVAFGFLLKVRAGARDGADESQRRNKSQLYTDHAIDRIIASEMDANRSV